MDSVQNKNSGGVFVLFLMGRGMMSDPGRWGASSYTDEDAVLVEVC